MGKGGGQPSRTRQKKDLVKVSVAEFLQYYEQPISEEQAWAICFQCCCKMRELVARGGESMLQMVLLKDLDNLFIHSDGSVSFAVQQSLSDSHMTQQQNEKLEDTLTELLGKLVYRALDWGIESHMERELSEALEKLISFMLKLNLDATKSAVTFQDVIKICEDHFLKPSEAADHYSVVCQVLFAEYIEIQKLMLTIQSCKEYLGRMDVEDWCPRQKADDWANLWQDVLGGLQKGTRLHKATEQPQPRTSLKQCACSLYNTVVDDIKNKHYTLHKASTRLLKERVCQAPSLHDQLMMEVKNPPKLRPVFLQKSRNKPQDFGKFSLTAPVDIFLDQNVGSNVTVSQAKKPRLNGIQSDPELKLLSTCNRKPSTRRSLPTIADLMGTRYAEQLAEMKDSSQRDNISSSRSQVCLACHNELFIWPYMCHLCSRVSCKDCCVKVTMPVRPCVRLPLNFFKIIRFSKEDLAIEGQKTPQLLYEIEHWDCSRVPLVLEPHCLAPPLAARTRSMTNWPSLDICLRCEQHLLAILARQVQQQMPRKKRSLSWTEWD
ncbi:protein spire homolog 2-like isoform X2 [Paroedura picta]|uniref:protein spire homolog 2-like isoform X2 n=1 Tax=Paroedura picta TaxID=143630 RepID=UPI004056BC35